MLTRNKLMSDNSSKSNVWPFLLGLLAGAVLGVLLAPEKGEITRKKLKKKTSEIKGNLAPSFTGVRERLSPLVTKISEKAAPIISGFKKIEEFEKDVKDELTDTFDEEEDLPVDTSLSEHKIDLPKEEHLEPTSSHQIPPKPKRKSFFKNIK